LRRQNTSAANRRKSRNRLAVAGNNEFGTGLDFAHIQASFPLTLTGVRVMTFGRE
jgi:hypothetical protein